MCKPKLHREYDEETGKLIKLECGICHEIKTADCFRKNKSKKDGIQSQCKQCCSEIDVIDFCQANNLDFMQGNVIKYVFRYKNKNGLEDLEKAKEYIDRMIENLLDEEESDDE